ncbi:MAG TPA: 50S ribosomal protein L32 [Clostridiales bacterium]|jgi:large subunit ribosomal protein L32|nr:50S ribosomal protein L32 [Clostridiales bacterium]
MAVPKRKTSKARRDKRRSQNMKMTAPALSTCPQCHEQKLPHRVCPTCNYYDGKAVIAEQVEVKR